MKKFMSLFLALALVLSLGMAAFAEPNIIKVESVAKSDIDNQLEMIFSYLPDLSQDTEDETWNYAITDLDHDGNLELIAAVCKGSENITYAKIFEVSEDREAFVECDMGVAEGEPFVDIIKVSADTYYDKTNDAWYYMFVEDYTSGATEHYSVKCSISLKDGYVTPKAYAKQHTEFVDGYTTVSFADLNDNEITPEEFNRAGNVEFAGFEKSSTNFSWFTLADARNVSVITESYQVFAGSKNVSEVSVQQVYTNPSVYGSDFLIITKDPTNESHYAGENAIFIAKAAAGSNASTEWVFVSPNGQEYNALNFGYLFPDSKVTGAGSETLKITNVSESMNGWGFYCKFTSSGSYVNSSTAYLNILQVIVTPTYPTTGSSVSGTIASYLVNTVSIYLDNGSTVQVSSSKCYGGSGSITAGSRCNVYYNGTYPSSSNITYVDVFGTSSYTPYYDYGYGYNSWNAPTYDYSIMHDLITDNEYAAMGYIRDNNGNWWSPDEWNTYCYTYGVTPNGQQAGFNDIVNYTDSQYAAMGYNQDYYGNWWSPEEWNSYSVENGVTPQGGQVDYSIMHDLITDEEYAAMGYRQDKDGNWWSPQEWNDYVQRYGTTP